ncbi:hypothetical protein GMJLKIPL_3392 [Methylobacterium isbiliense]|uniref:DNA (cytosine-5-)-methyltransferase n=1 Tax=Methylobacterium isbiliense TaxID=315478 RepID=A0ABQ4SII3_9HYPH|nr:hypothetical protein GMJLKIPL_3392 [Methylobacterium isbiliense]
MRAYYNEVDPYAAAWIRNLIAAGHVCPGDVDERDIRDVRPGDLAGYTRCHFFAGIAVWDYALGLAGWPAERPVWIGSCPCQPFSKAGRGEGFADERHLWPAWHHLIRERRPATILGEQVAGVDGLAWLDLVSADMEGEGYALAAADMPAAGVGAPHIRQRLWFVADAVRGRAPAGSEASARDQNACGARGRMCAEPRDGRLFGSMADAPSERWDRSELSGAAETAPAGVPEAEGRRAAGLREPAGRGATVGLGDPRQSRGRRHARAILGAQGEGAGKRSRVGREPDEPVDAGATRFVGHPGGQGLSARERNKLRGARRREEGRTAQQPSGDAWADVEWLPCRDGKARPTQPGLFPLAHGAPARVGRLRAYGNAIVAPLAAEFIRAVLDLSDGEAPRPGAGLPLFAAE